MNLQLFDIIEKIYKNGIESVGFDIQKIDKDTLNNLTNWFYEDNVKHSTQDVLKALQFISWRLYDAENIWLWSQTEIHKEFDFISENLSLSRDKVVQLLKKDLTIDKKQTYFVAFEGIDGSGKTTYMNSVKKILEKKGCKVKIFSFPVYHSFFGKEIGIFLSGKNEVDATTIDPKSMSLWYAMDRWHSLNNENYQNYDFIFFNRYTLSSVIYQGLRESVDNSDELINWIFNLEYNTLKLPKPDIYFIFDIDPELAQENIKSKGNRSYIGDKKDVYEKQKHFLEEARKLYKNLNDVHTKIEIINVSKNHQLANIDEIAKKVVQILL